MRLAIAPAVLWLEFDGFEDQEIEGALNEINWFTHLTTLTVYNTLDDCRLSR